MNFNSKLMETIVIKPEKVEIDPILKNEIKTLCEEESQVVVHCSVSIPYLQFMRVWKSTFLIPHNSSNICSNLMDKIETKIILFAFN